MSKSLAQRNLEYCNELINLKKGVERSFLVIGEMLWRIRDEERFRPHWETFTEYLLELGWDDSVASRYISVFKTLIYEYKLDEATIIKIGWSNAYDVVRASHSKDDAQKLLDECSSAAFPSQVRASIREARTGVKEDLCKHKWQDVHFRQCENCGKREKVYDE